MKNNEEFEYAGFWIRIWASVIDLLLILLVTIPVLLGFYGSEYFESDAWVQGPLDFELNNIFPAFATILFWRYESATPGKMAISAKIVDAVTGEPPSLAQCIGRYFAYIISIIALGLGVFWIAFDRKKQGWHDKLAGTVVIRKKDSGPQFVKFNGQI